MVLAAGNGSRIGGGALPKPLRPIGGVPLIVRVLRTLGEAGIGEVMIVVGHQGDEVRRAIESEPGLPIALHFAVNDRFMGKNGLSLLAASSFVEGECLLAMADHLCSPDLVRKVLCAQIPEGACVLGVDHEIDRCFDLEDATKVRIAQDRVADIGKDLDHYDAIDTGVFRIGPALCEELGRIDREAGDCSLSDGVRALAIKGRFHAFDVGRVRWIDVDTPAAILRAEAMIRVFGDRLCDEPAGPAAPAVDPEAMELFAPTWVRAAKPYNEDHFALAERQGDVLRMMSNESPFAPSPRVLEAIARAASQANLYPTSGKDLKRCLAQREGLEAGSVLLGCGSAELIDIVIRTFVAPGEEVLLSVPTFSMYEARTRTAGGIPVLVPMTDDHELDVPALIHAVTERTKVIFLCTPNNPTGNCIPEPELRRILRLGLPTVIDEAYLWLGSHGSFVHLLGEFPNAIFLRTFSKALGLAGLRLGYAIAHPAVTGLLSRVKIPWNVPSVIVAAAMAVLEDHSEQDARMAELCAAREGLIRDLEALPGVVPLPSEGNFVMLDVSGTSWTADDLVAALLAEGALIRSLAVHHAKGRRFVRITVGTAEQNTSCVAMLGRVLSRPRRTARGPFDLVGRDAGR
ncbi:MAG: histidinol-phosphate transaminase [Deltaproteobacteria bacterium]|nr:histidinol-phosphate transaminase [Deltaproteobacteria bacterium]